MLHSSKTSLAKELGVNRNTIPRMLDRGEVKVLYTLGGKRFYVHILNHIKELVGNQ